MYDEFPSKLQRVGIDRAYLLYRISNNFIRELLRFVVVSLFYEKYAKMATLALSNSG